MREGIVKHSRDLTPGESPDLDEYLPELRPPLEAQLIDLADEIAYNAADLDDAYEAGLVRLEDIAAAVPAYAAILDTVETSFPGATERERFLESVRHLMDGLVSGLIEGTVAFARASGAANVEAVRHFPSRIVRFTDETAITCSQSKAPAPACSLIRRSGRRPPPLHGTPGANVRLHDGSPGSCAGRWR